MANNKTKILTGALASVIIGAAAGFLFMSEPGKRLRKDLQKKLADFYSHIAPQLEKMKEMGEEEYKKFIKNAAATYGKNKKFSEKEIKELTKEAQELWGQFGNFKDAFMKILR